MTVPVLMYHHVAPDREVTPAQFDSQLGFLKKSGYSTAGLGALHLHLSGAKPLPKKTVIITFDDGYADNWTAAFPLLKKHGFNAVVFATTARIDAAPPGIRPTMADGAVPAADTRSDERGPFGFMSWEELRAAVSAGVFEIGSHTHTHNGFDKNAAWRDIAGELKTSKELIEKNLGARCTAVAWPWGFYGDGFVSAARGLGYESAFTTKPGANAAGSGLFAIKRFKVRLGDTGWLARRLLVYSNSLLAGLYGAFYGLDTAAKRVLLKK